MTRHAGQDQLLARREGRATGLRRGTVILYEACVPDATGSPRLATDPVLVPEGESRFVAGLRFTLQSLRAGPWRSPRGLSRTLAAVAHNLRGGRRLGTVVILTRRQDASWAA